MLSWSFTSPDQQIKEIKQLASKSPLRKASVGIILADIQSKPCILLTMRSAKLRTDKGEFVFPGGKQDSGETASECCHREIKEEIGLDKSLLKLREDLYLPPSFSPNKQLVSIFIFSVDEKVVVDAEIGKEFTKSCCLEANTDEVEFMIWLPLAVL